jgi:hypothetical protein
MGVGPALSVVDRRMAAALLGTGGRQSRDRRGPELGQHRVALGQLVVDLWSLGQQADDASPGEVAQDAHAR